MQGVGGGVVRKHLKITKKRGAGEEKNCPQSTFNVTAKKRIGQEKKEKRVQSVKKDNGGGRRGGG